MFAFVHRYLDPEESLVEVLFGLVMALTMTVGARIFWSDDDADVTGLVLALLGCNLAWGVIDGMFYLVGTRFGRNQAAHLARRLRRTRNDQEALDLIEREVDVDETVLTDAEDRARLRRLLVQVLRRADARPARNTPQEIAAALVVGILVTTAAVPGVACLLLIEDAHTALMVANTAQVVLLFWIGQTWARFAGAPPLRTGAAVALLGTVLVGIAVALGG
jgi:hypothetical protein